MKVAYLRHLAPYKAEPPIYRADVAENVARKMLSGYYHGTKSILARPITVKKE